MSLRRISEDVKLRPLLSAHFDKQNFIKNLIKDGQNDKYLSDISLCIEDVNIEIKDYISKHTDTLMTGMQDFALLANRYSTLSSSSLILHKKVDRLKADTLEMHDVIQLKTNELERIHNSSISLRLLRQFVAAKSQLDHQFKNLSLDSFDTRVLASAAKLLFEVEMLIRSEHLKEIDCIKCHLSYLKDLGQQLRRKSQEKLLSALKEKNQASVANCLQIFFNLQSLPEVILLAIDVTVKNSIDVSKALIDIDEIQRQYNVAPQPVVKKGGKSVAQSTVNLNQSKLIMKEMSYSWATAIYEQANQILVLQKVLLKKEDPASHMRFIDVIGHINDGSASSHHDKTNAKNSHSNLLLSKGDLISLFWARFSSSLQDVSIEKLKYNPTVAVRLYPYLRKSGLEAYESLEKLLFQNETNVFLSSNQTTTSITSGDASLNQTYAHDKLDASYDELFLSLGFKSKDNKDSIVSETSRNIPNKKTNDFDSEKGFILGLKPLKDRHSIETLVKLNEPVLQMFPSTEGYSSAVPSKRDLQAWIKVITSEIVTASLESDLTLVMSVCRESVKSIEFLLTKIEDMVYNGNEIKKIVQNQNIFIKNSHQDHNTQLLVLLTSLKDELERLPTNIVKIVQDIPGGFSLDMSFTHSISRQVNDDADRKKSGIESLRTLLNRFVYFINKKIDILMKDQLLLPIVESLTVYCKSQLQSLQKEPVATHVNPASSNSSKTVQLFVRQLPDFFRVYMFSLPNSAVVSSALKETMERIMCMFISYSSLRRPMTESYKLQITTDCNLLEETLQPLGYRASGNSIGDVNSSIVVEFKSFQHLLFEDLSGGLENRISNEISSPPSKEKVFSLSYIGNIRPSTLLSFLFSSAPSLLPMPSDNVNFFDYLFTLSKSTNQIIIKESFEDLLNHNTEGSSSEDSEAVFPESYTLLYSSAHNWKSLESQQKSWLIFQECLDVFVQRLSVSDDANQRNLMRKWYEVVLLVGGQYFGVCEPTV